MIDDTAIAWQGAEFRKSSYSGGQNSDCVELAWRKSSYSGGENSDCVELAWRKSSHSGGANGSCVEVASSGELFGVRDSKNADGPVITLAAACGHRFVAAVRDGRLGRP